VTPASSASEAFQRRDVKKRKLIDDCVSDDTGAPAVRFNFDELQ
jgi:hypothetical protein